jgi:hypothetical protein
MGWHTSRDEENGWPWLIVCDAFAKTFLEPIYEIVGEGPNGEKGWTKALDPDNCPVDGLPFLAQFVGAVLTPGMSEEQRRLEIKEPTGWKRGQLPSIILIAQRELTGEKWVRVRERTPAVGELYLRVLAAECPRPDRVEAELLTHGVPAWIKLDFAAIEGVHWADVSAGWKSVEALDGAFPTVDALTHMLLDELPE